MGKTKDYLGFVPAGNLNIIASGASNVSFVTLENQEGRFVASAACEHVVIWDMRRGGQKAQVFNGERSPVTSLCASPNKEHLAVGYADGLTHIFDLNSGDLLNPFQGHSSAITTLAFDKGGFLLATGSNDTDIVVWDMPSEKGVCRLSGHTGAITKLVFMSEMSILISASKDTHIKFWDCDQKRCVRTVVGLGSEVWSVALMNNEKYMVTAASDQTLGIWKLTKKDEESEPKQKPNSEMDEDDDDGMYPLQCHKLGTVARAGIGRTVFMSADASGRILACHGKNKLIELFEFLPDEEAEAKLKKRLKRLRKKQKTEEGEATPELSEKDTSISVLDIVKRLKPIKLASKPKSLDVVLGRGSEVRVAVCMSDNQLELHALNCKLEENESKLLKNISYMEGHQSEVRAVAFSSDNQLIVSGSGDSVKSWNRPNQCRVITLETGYILCMVFAPGDRYVLAGTKEGKLLIIDIATGDIKEEIEAHDKEIWSICLTSDMRGIVTGGIDKTVKFWQFELIQDKSNPHSLGKVLSVIHSRTLTLEDGVLCARVSKNGKFLAVALLDTTVKIFFVDSFKFFVSLYGHSLPVLTMDISTDSALIATGSSDRNIKIWGMDYGNCHKSIFAHDDSITGLQFVPGTHFFFTCGRDGKIKQWDGDSFKKIITLQGHIGEAFGLAVSPNGKFVISCGSDRVLRLYEQTDLIIEIGDQEEMEREQNEPLATGKETVVPGVGVLSLPSKKTVGSEKGAENILEALQVCEDYQLALDEANGEKIPLPQLMMAYQVETIDEYLMKVFSNIRPSDMEQALLLLSFDEACKVMKYCPDLLEKNHDLDTVLDIYTFLLRVHHSTIIQTKDMYETIERFTKISEVQTKEMRDLIGRNYYALKYLIEKHRKTHGLVEFEDLTLNQRKKNNKRKGKRNYDVMVMNS